MRVSSLQKDRSGERGSILIMTAIFALLLLLMVGLCIDVSRIYLIRAELQNAADAAALAAARELNGGTGGIDDAIQQASAHINTQGLRAKSDVAIATVEFAVTLNGTYMNATDAKAAGTVKNIRYVRVTTQAATTNILFASSALGVSRAESRQAVAGMSVGLSGICDFFPAAVALTDPSPAPGTLMRLRFKQSSGNLATLEDQDYSILEVPDINGNRQVDTALLTAGIPTFCKNLGDSIQMTPSLDPNNGPRAVGDGMNTRFNVYANDVLEPSTFPPDSNIQENIAAPEYINRTAVTPPNPNAPGMDDRRMLVAPIIPLGTYPPYPNIQAWGIFFLRSKVPTDGSIPVEYVGRANVAANGDPTCSSGLTTPVLYK